MKALFFLVIFLVGCHSASDREVGESRIVGVSFKAFLGFDSAQVHTALSTFEDVPIPALNFLYGTFGESPHNVKVFTDRFQDIPHILSIDLSNETCRRFGRYCEKDREVLPFYNSDRLNQRLVRNEPHVEAAFRARALEILAFVEAVRNHNTTIYLNSGLENNFSLSAAKHFFEPLRLLLSGYHLGWNPVDAVYLKHPFVPESADFLQLHDLQAEFPIDKACHWSNDGTDIDFGNGTDYVPAIAFDYLKKRVKHYSDRCIVWVWWNTQGLVDPWKPPSKRQFKIDPLEVKQVNQLLKELQ